MDDELGPAREPLWPADPEPAPAEPWVARVPTPPLWEPDPPAPPTQSTRPTTPPERPAPPAPSPAPSASHAAPPAPPAQSAPLIPSISEEQTARIPTFPPFATPTPYMPPASPAAPVSPAAAPDVSEAQTARIPTYPTFPPLVAPPQVSEAATERMPTPPPAAPPATPPPARHRAARSASDAPTTRIPSEPSLPSLPPLPPAPLRSAPLRSAPPRPATRPSPPPLPAPLRPPAPKRPLSQREATLAWARDHWRLLTLVCVALVALVTAGSAYVYAGELAAQPQRIVTRYCAALVRADYKTAYGLLAPATQAQTPLAQYIADGAARDTISGRVTACAGAPAQALSALSFLSNPRSVIIPLNLTRVTSAQGQIALSRDVSGWHVADLSADVAGVDLGPLHAEQALCSAFKARDYNAAYGLLSAPYQHEQGSEQSFARDFGANLAITGCEPALKGYKLDKAGQRASFQVTLDVSVTGGGSATKLALPATMSLVREQGGWRVDAITPSLNQ